MEYKDKIVDKQVGRNSDLYAQSIAELNTPEERYPHLRILVSIIEQAHPEWNQAPHKDRQIANIVFKMSRAIIGVDEVAEIVRLRDAERGYGPLPDDDRSPRNRNTEAPEGDDRVSNSKAEAAKAAKAETEKVEAEAGTDEKPAPRGRKRPAPKKTESQDAAAEGDAPKAAASKAKSAKPEAEIKEATKTKAAPKSKAAPKAKPEKADSKDKKAADSDEGDKA